MDDTTGENLKSLPEAGKSLKESNKSRMYDKSAAVAVTSIGQSLLKTLIEFDKHCTKAKLLLNCYPVDRQYEILFSHLGAEGVKELNDSLMKGMPDEEIDKFNKLSGDELKKLLKGE